MSDERALPEQASLRYLKLEAKRRRAAGEFATLHDAQLAIAREHGQRSWSALREAVDAAHGKEGHALAHGYVVAADGTFKPAAEEVSVFAAAVGLWTTAADLVRFGLGWQSLLPRSMAAQALRPHARQPTGAHVGLGWAVNEPTGLFGIAGEAPGAAPRC